MLPEEFSGASKSRSKRGGYETVTSFYFVFAPSQRNPSFSHIMQSRNTFSISAATTQIGVAHSDRKMTASQFKESSDLSRTSRPPTQSLSCSCFCFFLLDTKRRTPRSKTHTTKNENRIHWDVQLRARTPKKHEVRLCDVQHAQLSGAHLPARRDFQNNNLGEHGREALAGNEDKKKTRKEKTVK